LIRSYDAALIVNEAGYREINPCDAGSMACHPAKIIKKISRFSFSFPWFPLHPSTWSPGRP